MESSPPANPYHPDDPALAAFAGREAAFARLHQHLTSPTHVEAVLFLGRRRIGKTALLRHVGAFFDETFIDVYVPLKQAVLENEDHWLLQLVQATGKALAARDFTLSRLPEAPDDPNRLRAWFAESYLHELLGILRYRRLVLLLDDVEALIQAAHDDRVPADHVAYLQGLLQRYRQLGIALTLDTQYETSIAALSPLVNAAETFRLTNLSQEESRRLLQKPITGLYTVSDESADAIYRATGGQPLLLQRAGYHLFERYTAQPLPPTPSPTGTSFGRPRMERGSKDTLDEVKQVINQVYPESEAEFRATWQQTTRDERLVLTAMVSLLYDDPLEAIDTASIVGWLVETDYPLDTTAINAARRSLEYAEVVHSTQTGLAITAGMMQTWLLENARLTDSPTEAPRPQAFTWDWRWVIVVAILLVIGLLLAISLGSGGQPGVNSRPLPTVTLAGGD